MQFLQPKGWKQPKGYANGTVAEGRLVSVGGQIGWTADQIFETDDFVAQAEQALHNVVTIVAEAGGSAQDIVRLTWYVTDKQAYLGSQKALGEAYRRVMGHHFPAMTLVQVSALVEDEARVEIEATAVVPMPSRKPNPEGR